MAKISPTQRALKLLRDEGWIPQIVEKWIPQARRRVDLFGLIDIIAIQPGIILGVQCTSQSHISDHIHKALAETKLKEWLRAGGWFEIWGFGKKGKRGQRKLWCVTKRRFSLNDLGEPEEIT